jgi:hypothetical protein
MIERRDSSGRLHGGRRPAWVGDDGSRLYYKHGVLHRLRGPAVIRTDGTREWWVDGCCLRRQESDGGIEVIRAEAPRRHGGETWRPTHGCLPEAVFRAVWRERICARLTMKQAEKFDSYTLAQVYGRLPHGREKAQARHVFGSKRGLVWLRGACVQERIILCLDGDPRSLAK